MDNSVWVSFAFTDTKLVTMSFTNDLSETNTNRAIETIKANKLGQPVAREGFPTALWANEDGVKAPPPLMDVNGIWVVSEKAAAVLQKFDLGAGGLYPVSLFKADRKTLFGQPYYCWNFGNNKSALSADASLGLRPFGVAGVTWNFPWTRIEDDSVAVSKTSLEGPDVWLDPLLFKSLFVSGPLGSALKSAGLGDAFRLRRARVI